MKIQENFNGLVQMGTAAPMFIHIMRIMGCPPLEDPERLGGSEPTDESDHKWASYKSYNKGRAVIY